MRRGLLWFGVPALCVVLAINAGVRWFGGGDPNWLSPLHLPDKARALAALSWHFIGHDANCEQEASRMLVVAAARRHHVPEALALAVAHAESSLRPHVISRTGAMGVMQLMPGTASWLGVHDAFDPADNCDAGARYLAWLSLRYHGDRARLLAAYNAGPGRVAARGAVGVGADTRAYVARVLDGARQ